MQAIPMSQLKMVSQDILLHSHHTYCLGEAAINYSGINLFARHGRTIQWKTYGHSVNPQHQGAFVSHLSAFEQFLKVWKERLVMLVFGVEEEEK
jgi:hypothetical protein